MLTDLCVILGEQKEALTTMLKLAKEERDVLVSGESEKLEAIIRLELKEISRLGAIEKTRVESCFRLAEALNIPTENITVTKIAEAANPDEREEITKIQKELMDIIDEHAKVNKENRQLIATHIEYSQTMLELMVGVEDPLNNMYGGDGKSTSDIKRSTGLYDGHA
jgi:flagellar biosynthesis/type III secretory pathway chaperone